MSRTLNDEELSVLGHLVELCCEAYWQEATACKINFDSGVLYFSIQIGSTWNIMERKELSAEDYCTIVTTLERIFDSDNKSVKSRLCTVTMETETGKPIMNLWLDFERPSEEPLKHIIRLRIEDLIEQHRDESLMLMLSDELDSNFIN
ncbi:MAG: hypothetical protein RMM17_08050 [Acidobacteriota bacterium]|nr:hypothetical protein [Blastocatellia bacterium]MDW8412617.1 hypothetical protein [Acidobacteriota bacterium]